MDFKTRFQNKISVVSKTGEVKRIDGEKGGPSPQAQPAGPSRRPSIPAVSTGPPIRSVHSNVPLQPTSGSGFGRNMEDGFDSDDYLLAQSNSQESRPSSHSSATSSNVARPSSGSHAQPQRDAGRRKPTAQDLRSLTEDTSYQSYYSVISQPSPHHAQAPSSSQASSDYNTDYSYRSPQIGGANKDYGGNYSQPAVSKPSGYANDIGSQNYDPTNAGYQNNGYQNNGYSNNGYQNNGYQNNGYQNNGYQNNGYSNNGYQNNGYSNNGYQNNGYDGYSNEGYRDAASEGYLSDRLPQSNSEFSYGNPRPASYSPHGQNVRQDFPTQIKKGRRAGRPIAAEKTEPPPPPEEKPVPADQQLYFSRRPRQVGYRPYSMKDFHNLPKKVELGSLGPDLDDPNLLEKKAQRDKVKEFARNLHAVNQERLTRAPPPEPKPQPKKESAREKALKFAQNVPRPRPRNKSNPDPDMAEEEDEASSSHSSFSGPTTSLMPPRRRNTERSERRRDPNTEFEDDGGELDIGGDVDPNLQSRLERHEQARDLVADLKRQFGL